MYLIILNVTMGLALILSVVCGELAHRVKPYKYFIAFESLAFRLMILSMICGALAFLKAVILLLTTALE